MRTENNDRDSSINPHKAEKECVEVKVGREKTANEAKKCFTKLAEGRIERTVARIEEFKFCLLYWWKKPEC